ncbi:hypothetical protein HMI55_005430 [Coelomomyces lativittatus]|nr:hypothetical protein HMI55_005430 [Coelomomyces lativittatus]
MQEEKIFLKNLQKSLSEQKKESKSLRLDNLINPEEFFTESVLLDLSHALPWYWEDMQKKVETAHFDLPTMKNAIRRFVSRQKKVTTESNLHDKKSSLKIQKRNSQVTLTFPILSLADTIKKRGADYLMMYMEKSKHLSSTEYIQKTTVLIETIKKCFEQYDEFLKNVIQYIYHEVEIETYCAESKLKKIMRWLKFEH